MQILSVVSCSISSIFNVPQLDGERAVILSAAGMLHELQLEPHSTSWILRRRHCLEHQQQPKQAIVQRVEKNWGLRRQCESGCLRNGSMSIRRPYWSCRGHVKKQIQWGKNKMPLLGTNLRYQSGLGISRSFGYVWSLLRNRFGQSNRSASRKRLRTSYGYIGVVWEELSDRWIVRCISYLSQWHKQNSSFFWTTKRMHGYVLCNWHNKCLWNN